jgi:hypothetical protein
MEIPPVGTPRRLASGAGGCRLAQPPPRGGADWRAGPTGLVAQSCGKRHKGTAVLGQAMATSGKGRCHWRRSLSSVGVNGEAAPEVPASSHQATSTQVVRRRGRKTRGTVKRSRGALSRWVASTISRVSVRCTKRNPWLTICRPLRRRTTDTAPPPTTRLTATATAVCGHHRRLGEVALAGVSGA